MTPEDSFRSLSLDYLDLLINGQAFSDVTFSVEGRLIHAHGCIVAARSLFFRKYFCEPNAQSGPDPLRMGPRAQVIPVNSVGVEKIELSLFAPIHLSSLSLLPLRARFICCLAPALFLLSLPTSHDLPLFFLNAQNLGRIQLSVWRRWIKGLISSKRKSQAEGGGSATKRLKIWCRATLALSKLHIHKDNQGLRLKGERWSNGGLPVLLYSI